MVDKQPVKHLKNVLLTMEKTRKHSAGKATTPVGDQRVAVPKKLRKKLFK